MARYERDFMGRVRGMFDRLMDRDDDRPRRRPMGASGPGAEGYYLSPEMAYDAEYALRQRERAGYDRGYGMAQFGRAGRGRGYSGDFRTGRGGYDQDEFFVNRRPGTSGYRGGGYERDLGMRGGIGYGADYRVRGYGAEYGGRGYDRGYRGRGVPHDPDSIMDQTSTRGGRVPPGRREHVDGRDSRTPFPRTYGR